MADPTGLRRKGHSYTLDGQRVPSVTSVLNDGVPKPQLISWAARTVAEVAVNRWDELGDLPVTDRLDLLKSAHRTQRDKAAGRGTDLHSVYEALVLGHDTEIAPEHRQAADLMVKLTDQLDIQPVLVERPIASRRWKYAGTPDLIADLRDGKRWLLDLKTGTGVYDSHVLQVAAYRFADVYVDAMGDEHPMPEVDAVGIIHLTPDAVKLIEVDAGQRAFQTFLHAMHVADWAAACKAAWRAHEAWPVGETVALIAG